MQKRFEIKNLNVKINKKTILSNITFDIYNDDFFVIIGSNGSGKSTLIKTLVRVNNNYFGEILFNNKMISNYYIFVWKLKLFFSIFLKNKQETKLIKQQLEFIKKHKKQNYSSKELAQQLSYVPQISEFPENVSVYEFIKMGLFPRSNFLGYYKSTDEIDKKINTLMKEMDILKIKDENIDSISGGQQQRALIALALLQDTNTIVLDEPTNHLDIKSQLEIIQILHNLHHKLNKTIVLVTHNLQLGIKYANRLCILENGKISAVGKTKEIINNEIIKKTFGVRAEIGYDKNKELKILNIELEDDSSLHN